MAQNTAGGVGFGAVVSSLFGGDAGKRPGSAHARVPGRGGFLRELYWPALLPAILLVAYGLLVVWSASLTNANASLPKQSIGAVLGLVGAVLIWRYDYRNLQNLSTWLLVLDVVLMLSPHIPGLAYNANGMTGWVKLGPLQFQPSEVGKLVTIFLMASLTAQFNGRVKEFRDYAKLCATLLVPFVAIMTQPDLGSGADLPIMAANQALMALDISGAYGRGADAERLGEVAVVLALALSSRSLARRLCAVLPGLGLLIKAGIAYGGTYCLGEALVLRLELAERLGHGAASVENPSRSSSLPLTNAKA